MKSCNSYHLADLLLLAWYEMLIPMDPCQDISGRPPVNGHRIAVCDCNAACVSISVLVSLYLWANPYISFSG